MIFMTLALFFIYPTNLDMMQFLEALFKPKKCLIKYLIQTFIFFQYLHMYIQSPDNILLPVAFYFQLIFSLLALIFLFYDTPHLTYFQYIHTSDKVRTMSSQSILPFNLNLSCVKSLGFLRISMQMMCQDYII